MKSGGETAGLAVAAVGADEDWSDEGLCRAVGKGDVQLDVGGELAEGEDGVDAAEFGTAIVAARSECLLQAEMVEALADGHGAKGLAQVDANLAGFIGEAAAMEEGRAGFLENNVMAVAFEDGLDGVAKSLKGLASKAAGAGFMAWEVALVEEQDAPASAGEVVGCGATCRTSTNHDCVVSGFVRSGHGQR